jgi:energy-coupling factor transporter ATP-binding protein EcfA2
MDPNRITYFAETDARNKKLRFGIKAKDRLKHVYVIGKTGMGKSTLLENMAIQDIQNGEGMAFIDPHGGTAEKLLDYVPESRIKDVLYFAPFDLEYPVSFNVMEDIGVDKRHLVVNGLMSTFEKIWVDAWSARMAYILSNTLLALLEYPGATLLGVNRMLADKEYRRKIVENVKDPSVKSFWIEEFGKYTEKFAAEATPAIQNKVGQFTSNPIVRNLIGQPESSFNIRQFMDEKKILIINLSKGRVGEGNANLIGSMLITKIYLAAMSRADASEQELAKLPNFYLYVDEFQSFANKSFADILSEARKYKLNLTIAHQYIEQMEEEVRDAVFGNVGTMVTFRVGAFDAEVLEKEFAPIFTAEDLVNLGFAQIYLKLMIDGVSSQPFSATTMGPIARPQISFKDAVVESSRSQFARPRAVVEENIRNWHDQGTAREVRPMENRGESRPDNRPENRTAPSRPAAPQPDLGAAIASIVQKPPVQPSAQQQPPQQRHEESRRPNNTVSSAPSNSSRDMRSGSRDASQQQPADSAQPDANKLAFLKAAEELKAKERAADPVPQLASPTPPVASLKDLARPNLQNSEAKKVPTKENLSSLRDALSSVIQKPAPKAEEQKPKDEPKPAPRAEPAPRTETGKQKEESAAESRREVPEDVLRKILDMEK